MTRRPKGGGVVLLPAPPLLGPLALKLLRFFSVIARSLSVLGPFAARVDPSRGAVNRRGHVSDGRGARVTALGSALVRGSGTPARRATAPASPPIRLPRLTLRCSWIRPTLEGGETHWRKRRPRRATPMPRRLSWPHPRRRPGRVSRTKSRGMTARASTTRAGSRSSRSVRSLPRQRSRSQRRDQHQPGSWVAGER